MNETDRGSMWSSGSQRERAGLAVTLHSSTPTGQDANDNREHPPSVTELREEQTERELVRW